MAVDEFSQEVGSQLSVWWVFGLSRDYSDRPPRAAWSTNVVVGSNQEDRLTLTIGEVPEHIPRAIRYHQATLNFTLDRLFGGKHADLSVEEQDRLLDERMANEDVSDVTGNGRFDLWASLEVCRDVTVKAHPNAKYFWVQPETFAKLGMDVFLKEATDYLSVAVACLQAELGYLLQIDKTLLRSRAYLSTAGRASLTEPKLSGSAYLSVSSTGWEALDFEKVAVALEKMSTGAAEMKKLLRTASGWLWTALAEEEDHLRRFVFSFLGLEVLVNKVVPLVESSLAEQLRDELGGLPVKELLWPAVRDDDQHPSRNLVFRFTCLAVALSRSTAADDVGIFRRLAKFRNGLAHGAANSLDHLPANESIDLLRRYVGYVAKAQAEGRLS